MEKKGQLQQLGTIGIGVAVFAITIIIAFLVIGQSQTAVQSDISTINVVNESIAYSNTTAQVLVFAPNSLEFTCLNVYNGSDGKLLDASNYTCNVDGLIFTGKDPQNGTVDVDYAHKQKSSAYNGSMVLESATEGVPGWIPLFIITMIGVIMIGLTKGLKA